MLKNHISFFLKASLLSTGLLATCVHAAMLTVTASPGFTTSYPAGVSGTGSFTVTNALTQAVPVTINTDALTQLTGISVESNTCADGVPASSSCTFTVMGTMPSTVGTYNFNAGIKVCYKKINCYSIATPTSSTVSSVTNLTTTGFTNTLASESVLVDDGTLYAAGVFGIYKTNDDGVTWLPANSGLILGSVFTQIISVNNVLYARQGDILSVYKSTNGGESWTAINAGLPTGDDVVVTQLYATGNGLYAALSSGGMYKLTSAGDSWGTAGNTDLPDGAKISSIFKGNNTFYAGTENHGVLESGNNGSIWRESRSGLSGAQVNYVTGTANSVLAATNLGVYVKSESLADEWSPSNQGLPDDRNVQKLILIGTTWYAIVEDSGVYSSPVNNISWSLASDVPSGVVVALTAVDSNTWYASTQEGLYKSTNAGDRWQALAGSPAIGLQTKPDGNTRCFSSGAKIYCQSSPSSDWVLSEAGRASGEIDFLTKVDDTIYAGVADTGLYKLTDSSATWVAANSGLPENPALDSFVADGSTLYLGISGGTGGGVYKSDNAGEIWTALDDIGLPAGAGIHVLAVHDHTVFAGLGELEGVGQGVYETSDGGETWSRFGTGLPAGIVIESMIVADNYLFIGSSASGVYRISFTGTEWQKVSTGLSEESPILQFLYANETLYAALGDGVYQSVDDGGNWTKIATSSPLQDYPVLSLSITESDQLLLGTVFGLWQL
jgi:photosystem II stability/assembly factor-like uncharacterized protein